MFFLFIGVLVVFHGVPSSSLAKTGKNPFRNCVELLFLWLLLEEAQSFLKAGKVLVFNRVASSLFPAITSTVLLLFTALQAYTCQPDFRFCYNKHMCRTCRLFLWEQANRRAVAISPNLNLKSEGSLQPALIVWTTLGHGWAETSSAWMKTWAHSVWTPWTAGSGHPRPTSL